MENVFGGSGGAEGRELNEWYFGVLAYKHIIDPVGVGTNKRNGPANFPLKPMQSAIVSARRLGVNLETVKTAVAD
jgi:hypothetical protein